MPSKYRKAYQAEVDRSRSENDVKLKALMSDSSFAAAATRGGFESQAVIAIDEAAINQATAVLQDRTKDLKIRMIALNALNIAINQDAQLFEYTLALLASKEEPTELRMLALQFLRQASFGSDLFDQYVGQLCDQLRGIVQDANDNLQLRSASLSFLAGRGDEFAQNVLVTGLKSDAEAIVSPFEALQLLSADSHFAAPEVLEGFAMNEGETKTRELAIRILGRDVASHKMLLEILKDKSENPEVRQACAVSIRAAAPTSYQDVAREIALDDSENADVRATLLNAIGLDQATNKTNDPQFRALVEKIGSTSHADLKKSAETYLKNSAE